MTVPAGARWLLGRLAGVALALAALSVVVFVVTDVLPGDAVTRVAGRDATPEQRAEVAARLGLDRPAPERYLDWAGGVLRGDLGRSWVSDRPVTDVITDGLGPSVVLTGAAQLVALPVSLALGVVAGLGAASGTRRGHRVDRVVTTTTLAVLGLPEFLTAGLLLAVLAVGLGLFPPVSLAPLGGSVLDEPAVLVLPALALVLLAVGSATRLVRAGVLDVAGSPYVEAARLAGVRGPALVLRHVLPAALPPAVQAWAAGLGTMIGGAVVVETLFDYPGIGAALQGAVADQDVPVVQGLALTLCAITLLTLLAGDVVVRRLDPRAAS